MSDIAKLAKMIDAIRRAFGLPVTSQYGPLTPCHRKGNSVD